MRTLAASVILSWSVASDALDAEDPMLSLLATFGSLIALTIELFRWSSDGERDMVMSALSAPLAPTAASPSAVPPTPAGPAGGRGRGGRGGAPPPSPMAKLTAAIKAAPTLGYIWGQGPTGYAIKYAWRIAPVDGQPLPGPALSRVEGQDRIV